MPESEKSAGEIGARVLDIVTKLEERLSRLEGSQRRTPVLDIGKDTPIRTTVTVLIAAFLMGAGFATGAESSRERTKQEIRQEWDAALRQYPNRADVLELFRIRMDEFEVRLLRRIDERLKR